MRTAISRERILDAAASEFDQSGYASTSMATIAASIGKEKGFVSHHFPAKNLLAIALVEQLHQQVPILTRQSLDATGSGLGALVVLTGKLAVMFRDNVRIRAALRLQREAATVEAPLPYPYEECIDNIERLLSISEQAGELLPSLDVTQTARVVVGAFVGIQQIANNTGQRAQVAEWTQSMWTALLPGLVPAKDINAFMKLSRT
jgi:AcrR family transcriptional regulator